MEILISLSIEQQSQECWMVESFWLSFGCKEWDSEYSGRDSSRQEQPGRDQARCDLKPSDHMITNITGCRQNTFVKFKPMFDAPS